MFLKYSRVFVCLSLVYRYRGRALAEVYLQDCCFSISTGSSEAGDKTQESRQTCLTRPSFHMFCSQIMVQSYENSEMAGMRPWVDLKVRNEIFKVVYKANVSQ